MNGLVVFLVGTAAGSLAVIAGSLYMLARVRRSTMPPRPDVPQYERRPLVSWSRPAPPAYDSLDRDAKLRRLEQVDCVLGFVLGDEPYLTGKLYRKENAR